MESSHLLRAVETKYGRTPPGLGMVEIAVARAQAYLEESSVADTVFGVEEGTRLTHEECVVRHEREVRNIFFGLYGNKKWRDEWTLPILCLMRTDSRNYAIESVIQYFIEILEFHAGQLCAEVLPTDRHVFNARLADAKFFLQEVELYARQERKQLYGLVPEIPRYFEQQIVDFFLCG